MKTKNKSMIKSFAFIASFFLFSSVTLAAPYTIDYGNSALNFSGVHAGQTFEGTFEEWSAMIVFDPDNLAQSSISAHFNPKTAKTGNPLYDGTLPQADWFDTSNFETATFKSAQFKDNGDGTYKVEGTLTIRGIEKPKIFTFSLSDLSQTPVKVIGNFKIDRLAYDIGKKSDPKAEWVSQYIDIKMDLSATR